MSAIPSLCYLIQVNPNQLSKEEHLILEAELFSRLCEELKVHFKNQYAPYFSLMKFTDDREKEMLEANFIRLVLKDIMLTEEYTIEGVAHYTGTPVDVLYEVLAGLNNNPSAILLQRIIDLHRSVRSDLYRHITQKILNDYFAKQSS